MNEYLNALRTYTLMGLGSNLPEHLKDQPLEAIDESLSVEAELYMMRQAGIRSDDSRYRSALRYGLKWRKDYLEGIAQGHPTLAQARALAEVNQAFRGAL